MKFHQFPVKCLALFFVSTCLDQANSFSAVPIAQHQKLSSQLSATSSREVQECSVSRRSLLQKYVASSIVAATVLSPSTNQFAAFAAERIPLEKSLYTILRVREATQQEARLIKSGKFKDVQRANVKLAVKFMVENYKVGDAFVAASSYLDGNERRVAANTAGQNAVQDLYTILEYFDSSDVQNLKISSLSNEKESVVLKGLEATRKSIDEFLGYFPADKVDGVKETVRAENDLNYKEFDRSLGDIINSNPST